MADFRDYAAANRANWDERAAIHLADETGFYGVDAVRRGEDRLDPIAAAAIGDVRGLRIAHLQCHFGLDSIALARRGASVTGLDFSPVAIAAARQLAAETGASARFVGGNVYDARQHLEGDYDMVFVSWGAINWLDDITRWATAAASLLAPGGRILLAESHPAILCFDWVEGRIAPAYDHRTPKDRPITAEGAQTYTGAEQELVNRRTYEWQHPLSDIIMALIGAGLTITGLTEHEALPWQLFGNMSRGVDGLYRLPEGHPALPLAFTLTARKA